MEGSSYYGSFRPDDSLSFSVVEGSVSALDEKSNIKVGSLIQQESSMQVAFIQMHVGDKTVFLMKADSAVNTLRHIALQRIAGCDSYEILFSRLSELCSSDMGLFI